MYKIMIVEDDRTVNTLIAEAIEKWQMEPIIVDDFNDVEELFLKTQPHLVLMDINLPVYDGFYWNQRIRLHSKIPIIFISSRNTNMDMVMAMNMGADDFVSKPFSTDVLVAKINALLRRTYNYKDDHQDIISLHNVTLNLSNSTVKVNDQDIDLSKNEYKLLQVLMNQSGQIVSRDHLLRSLWEDERFVDDNTLTVNINRLRKKIEVAGGKDFIKTKVGQGYIIE